MKENVVKADIIRNRLSITVLAVSKKELENLYTEIRFCVADLSPGFSVINDLTNCSLGALNALQTFRKISNYLIDKEVGVVIRVINRESLLFRQFVNLTGRMQGYKAITVATLEEAETELNLAAGRSAPRFFLNNQAAEIKTGEEVVAVVILDISTSGCALQCQTPVPIATDELTITIPFPKTAGQLNDFRSRARVVSIQSETLALQFIGLSVVEQERLRERLVHEAQSEILNQ
jgi:hypothetical protein